MKRKNTRRKVLAMTLSLAMVACAALSLSTTAKADRVPSSETVYSDYGEYVGGVSTATQDKVDGDTSNVLNVPVQARVVGEGDIVYFVSIIPGEMKFEYNYGSKWDPVNHKYDTTSGSSGWGTDYVDGTNPGVTDDNNKIHVINGSNFPIIASFAYEDGGTFGEPPTGCHRVGGIFSSTRGTLVTEVTNSNANPTTYDPSTRPYKTATLPLEMYIDTSQVNPGTGYYYKEFDNQLGKNEGDMFFALVGTPARNLQDTLGDFTEVGTITVTITPDSDVHSATTT